ncbi:MAG: hypothetical protein IJ962_07120 [Clostridia bacterium]|nr:hypothetical protein [Clostridia bacterium]
MAGYRPKSLNELNDMYDKTITAEKAIIKASRQLHDATESIVPPAAVETPVQDLPKEETKTVEALSSEVDSLINRFKSEMAAATEKPMEAAVKKAPATPAVPPEKISFDKPATEGAAPSAAKPKSYYDLEAPGEVAEKAAARSDERTELFEDYMKIMNDEDDDLFSKRESFKKKSKKKKHKKSFFSRHEPSEEVVSSVDEENFAESEQDTTKDGAPEAESSVDNLPVREVIYSPEASSEDNGLKIEFNAQKEEPSADDENEFSDFVEEAYVPTEQTVDEDLESESEEENNEEASEEQHPDFDIGEEKKEELPPVPQDIAETTYEDFMNSNDIYSYDPNKKNTIPDYSDNEDDANGEYEEYGEEDESSEDDHETFEEAYPAPKNKKGIIAGRVILSIILSIICVSAVAVSALNLVLGVNSGKETFGGKFIFTAESDYIGADILSGDLVITENRYAEDGEVFAYINYTQQCFMFGKRNGSIVNDSSDVLFIAENNGERVLVLRDDTKGVVEKVYPSVGKLVSLCSSYFIPILAILLVLGLVIVLLLTFVFKDKEKAYRKMIRRMTKKGIISDEDDTDYSYKEEPEAENLFSSIE